MLYLTSATFVFEGNDQRQKGHFFSDEERVWGVTENRSPHGVKSNNRRNDGKCARKEIWEVGGNKIHGRLVYTYDKSNMDDSCIRHNIMLMMYDNMNKLCFFLSFKVCIWGLIRAKMMILLRQQQIVKNTCFFPSKQTIENFLCSLEVSKSKLYYLLNASLYPIFRETCLGRAIKLNMIGSSVYFVEFENE